LKNVEDATVVNENTIPVNPSQRQSREIFVAKDTHETTKGAAHRNIYSPKSPFPF